MAVMRRLLLPAALLALLAAAPAHASWWFGARAKSLWASKPPVLDADEGDWDQRAFDDTAGITYGFANDADFLYIVYIPHTKMTKFQVTGGYKQVFTIWVYPSAKIKKTAGFAVASPGHATAIQMQPVGAVPAGAPAALAAMPEPDRRSVLEARLPLAAFGVSPGQTIAVGLEASPPDHAPAAPKVKEGQPLEREEVFRPIRVWIRVRLAKSPS